MIKTVFFVLHWNHDQDTHIFMLQLIYWLLHILITSKHISFRNVYFKEIIFSLFLNPLIFLFFFVGYSWWNKLRKRLNPRGSGITRSERWVRSFCILSLLMKLDMCLCIRKIIFLARACEANRGLCDRFALLIHIYIYIYIFIYIFI